MLNGDTRLIAHVGYPTTTFKSPMIYNPWFAKRGINAAVVPLGVRTENFADAFPEICRFTNFHGALITMPHKVSVIAFLDEVSTAVKVAGSCNAVRRDRRRPSGRRHVRRRRFRPRRGAPRTFARRQERARRRLRRSGLGDRRLVRGAGAAEIALYDVNARRDGSAGRAACAELSHLKVSRRSNDPTGSTSSSMRRRSA